MQTTTKKNHRTLEDWLEQSGRVMELYEQTDQCHRGEYGGFVQIGRRIIIEDQNTVEVEKYTNVSEACARFDQLYHDRGPEEFDSIIQEDRDSYYVSMEGSAVGTFATREEATYRLALAMVNAGVFGDSFYVDERGGWHRIDDEVRELHDDGGDQMREGIAKPWECLACEGPNEEDGQLCWDCARVTIDALLGLGEES